MLIYPIIAFILIIFSICEVFSEKFTSIGRKIYYIILTALALMFMTRWFVGWDWYNYYPDFQTPTSKFEIGYRVLTVMVRKTTENYQVFVGLNSLIDFLILGWVIPKYSKFPITTLFLYLGINGLALETDIMRNVKSILLFLVSIQYLEERKFFPYVILNILGMAFHITSIIYLPLYFILSERYSRKLILGLFILGNVIYFSNFELIGELTRYLKFGRVQGYIRLIPESSGGELNLFYLERVIFFFIAYYGEKLLVRGQSGSEFKKSENESENRVENLRRYRIFQNSAYIGIFIFLFMSGLSVIAIRLSLLFSFAYWFLFTIILENRELKRALRVGIYVTAMGIALFRGINFLSFQGNRVTYRYENYFFEKREIEDKKSALRSVVGLKEEGKRRELLILY